MQNFWLSLYVNITDSEVYTYSPADHYQTKSLAKLILNSLKTEFALFSSSSKREAGVWACTLMPVCANPKNSLGVKFTLLKRHPKWVLQLEQWRTVHAYLK